MKDSGMHQIANSKGFGLVSVLLWLLIVGSLIVVLNLRVASQATTTSDVERQLYSLVQASNGVEYARAVLPGLDVNRLIKGQDDNFSSEGNPEWRNPMGYARAQELDPAEWVMENDDGLPFLETGQLLPSGYASVNQGYFFIRFSNNPEEPADQDNDHIVLLRSMGIAPNRISHPAVPGTRNSVSLVEARLRQETTFDLPSPLTLLGDSGSFKWEGSDFRIEGGNHPAVSFVSSGPSNLITDFEAELTDDQKARITGANANPSYQDSTETYHQALHYKPVFESQFWSHFEDNLGAFSANPNRDIHYFPTGGILDSHYSGFLVARGDLTLANRSSIDGLLLHLGGGTLRLQGKVSGAVWMSNLDYSAEVLDARPLSLFVGEGATITFNAARIRQALAQLPPTQLGWRILFPEMTQ